MMYNANIPVQPSDIAADLSCMVIISKLILSLVISHFKPSPLTPKSTGFYYFWSWSLDSRLCGPLWISWNSQAVTPDTMWNAVLILGSTHAQLFILRRFYNHILSNYQFKLKCWFELIDWIDWLITKPAWILEISVFAIGFEKNLAQVIVV